MEEIDLIYNLEKISSVMPHRILKLEGYILKENYKEELEEIEERSKSFKPKPWWAYGLFYCYLIF